MPGGDRSRYGRLLTQYFNKRTIIYNWLNIVHEDAMIMKYRNRFAYMIIGGIISLTLNATMPVMADSPSKQISESVYIGVRPYDPLRNSYNTFPWTKGYDWRGTSAFKSDGGVMTIEHTEPNAAWFTKKITVEKNTVYRISAMCKVSGFRQGHENPGGASVGIVEDVYYIDNVTSNDWTRSEVIFNTGDKTEITLRLLLGNHSATVTGKAYFKDIKLERLEVSNIDTLYLGQMPASAVITSSEEQKSIETLLKENGKKNFYMSYNGHSYKIYNLSMSWLEAETYCKSLGGYLAVITTQAENDFLHNYLISNGGYEYAYIGLSRDNKFNWRWVNGEKLDYINWASGEPNNMGGEEKYGELTKESKWNDTKSCYSFICEWDTAVCPVKDEKDEFSDYRESKHFVCAFPTSYLSGNITPKRLKTFLSDLDKIYDAMVDLTGRDPFKAKKIYIRNSTDNYGALWVKGGPDIYWADQYVKTDMKYVNDNPGDVSFGPVHEIGHLFQISEWSYDVEKCASFKAFYAMAVTGVIGHEFKGGMDGVQEILRGWTVDRNDNESKFAYTMFSFAKDYGWDALKKTYRSYFDGSYPYEWQKYAGDADGVKFNELLDRLEFFSGVNIRKEYFQAKWLADLERSFPKKRAASVSQAKEYALSHGLKFSSDW